MSHVFRLELTASPLTCDGQLRFMWTRIPVRSVVEFFKAGYSDEQILAEYPSLTRAQIEGARMFWEIAREAQP